MHVLLPVLVLLGAAPPRNGEAARFERVGALARSAPLVVRGVVVAVEAHAPFGGLSLRQATLRVTRTLKGAPRDSVTFVFGVGDAQSCPGCPRPRLGQDGVWVLMSPSSRFAEFALFDPLAMAPPAAEPVVLARLATPPCPERAQGRCAELGWQCAYPEVLCSCEPACGGGLAYVSDHVPSSWVCRPHACATARPGEACVGDAKCEGCWGFPFVCDAGRWRLIEISAPPAAAVPRPQP